MTTHASTEAEIGLCLFIAAADGDISDHEVGALSTRLGTLLGDDFPLGELTRVVDEELRAMDALGDEAYLATLAQRIPEATRHRALRAAFRVAMADGPSEEEEEAFLTAAKALDVDPDVVRAALPPVRPARR